MEDKAHMIAELRTNILQFHFAGVAFTFWAFLAFPSFLFVVWSALALLVAALSAGAKSKLRKLLQPK